MESHLFDLLKLCRESLSWRAAISLSWSTSSEKKGVHSSHATKSAEAAEGCKGVDWRDLSPSIACRSVIVSGGV